MSGVWLSPVVVPKISGNVIEKITAEQLGQQRQNAHPSGTPRFFDDPNTEDIRGSLGEL